MAQIRVIIGDQAEEIRATQALSLAMTEALSRLERLGVHKSPRWPVGPLLSAACRSLALASIAGLDTPLEVLALSARNTLELWLRLLYVLASDENRQAWRDENLTDQIQVWEATLALETPDSPREAKAVILAEIDRVTQLAASRGLHQGKIMTTQSLAKATGCEAEYKAFYKLYSKLVHPSSWMVNSPSAVSAPMYRMTLAANVQVYGLEILKVVEKEFGVSSEECYESAIALLPRGADLDRTKTQLVQ